MKLTNENIDAVIEKIEKFFESLKVSKRDRVKLCFLLEEALLRFQEKFGEDYDFDFVTKKWFGTPKVLIRVKGAPYNPLEDDNEENIFSQNIMQNLLHYETAGTVYRYENGCNEISAFSTREARKIKIPGGAITILIVLAIVSALIVKQFSPSIQQIIIEDITTPILDKLLGTIIAFSIPLVFISVTASICSIEDVTTLNNISAKVLKRFFAIMFSIAIISVFVNALFFPIINFNYEGNFLSSCGLLLRQIFDLFLNMIPQNIIEPFLKGNVLQIIILALLFGIAITILGNRVVGLKTLIMDLKQTMFKVMDIVFAVTPLIIFLCIFKIIVAGSFSEILKVWKIIAADYVLMIIICGIMLLKIKVSYGVKISEFLKKLYPVFFISFTTGSVLASLAKNLEICKKDFKVEENFCDFYMPLAHTLCPTTMIAGLVTCVFFAAEFSNVQISVENIFIIIFLSVQFGLAASGGNGSALTALGLLFTQLGLSLDAIGTIIITDIFISNIARVCILVVRNCDLIDMSHQIKFSGEK